MDKPMTVKRTRKATGGEGSGFVMFGHVPGTAPAPETPDRWGSYGQKSRWFERHFPTAEKAEAYAAKRGWATEREARS